MLLKKTEKGAVYLVQRKVSEGCYKLYLKHCVKCNGKYRELFSTAVKDNVYYNSVEAARKAVKVLGTVYVKDLDWDTIEDPIARKLIYTLTILVK